MSPGHLCQNNEYECNTSFNNPIDTRIPWYTFMASSKATEFCYRMYKIETNLSWNHIFFEDRM